MKSRRALLAGGLCLAGGVSSLLILFVRSDGRGDVSIFQLRLEFRDEQDIVDVRLRIQAQGGSEFPDLEIQTVGEPVREGKLRAGNLSRWFQVRLSSVDAARVDRFSNDVKRMFEADSPPRVLRITRY